jgi:excisionase family DNA binding protein
MSPTPDDYLTTDELAALLRTTRKAIHAMRTAGTAPPAARVGKRLLFRRRDVDAWCAARLTTSTHPPA